MSTNLLASLAIYVALLGGLLFMGRDWQPPVSVATQNGQQVQSEMPDSWVRLKAYKEDRDCFDTSHTNIWCEE